MLEGIESRDEAFEAYDLLCQALEPSRNDKQVERNISTQAGQYIHPVTWHSRFEFWSRLAPTGNRDNRFWCAYGIENPLENERSLEIAVEINPRTFATDIKVGGAFARDNSGSLHLCHNGAIGGSNKGVGKQAFWDLFRANGGDTAIMLYGNGSKRAPVIDLGPITSNRLRGRIARFVKEVARIKKEVTGEGLTSSDSKQMEVPAFSPFRSEPVGMRETYKLNRRIIAKRDHGNVVNKLREKLRKSGYLTTNDQKRDLFVYEKSNNQDRISALFEVKTDTDTESIYKAVGQLLINIRNVDSKFKKRNVKLIMVIPGVPKKPLSMALKSLEIHVVDYKWRRDETPQINTSALNNILA